MYVTQGDNSLHHIFPFLEIGRYIRLSPIISKRLIVYIKVRIGAISELHSFNTLVLKPSGPCALCILKLFNSLRTPLESTVISPKKVNGLEPCPWISELDSRLKADSNCLLQMFVLSRVSGFKIPFTLRVVIPNVSFLRDLTNDQNFFIFSFFSGQSGSGFAV